MASNNERLSFLGRLPYYTIGSTGGVLTLNFSISDNFVHTTTQDTTVTPNVVPTTCAAQTGVVEFIQGSTPRVISFTSFFKFVGGVNPNNTQNAGAKDILVYTINSDGSFAICSWMPDVK